MEGTQNGSAKQLSTGTRYRTLDHHKSTCNIFNFSLFGLVLARRISSAFSHLKKKKKRTWNEETFIESVRIHQCEQGRCIKAVGSTFHVYHSCFGCVQFVASGAYSTLHCIRWHFFPRKWLLWTRDSTFSSSGESRRFGRTIFAFGGTRSATSEYACRRYWNT